MNTPPTGNDAGTGAPAQQATLREFFAVIFRRRWLILGLFFVVDHDRAGDHARPPRPCTRPRAACW